MLLKKGWKLKKIGTEGNCKLFGINIFDYDWNDTGEKVKVLDPQYQKEHEFNVYTVNIKGKTKKIAAGEFSNCVWGFFAEK